MSYMQNDIAVGEIQEMSMNEIDEVNGGVWPVLVILGVAAVVVIGVALIAGVIDGASGAESQTK
ncbi:MAG TPA: class IIb bacteriocin, lactobin A/cerein 7B family [Allosphingosinicella sp.]|jgi:lactobin A/cerein 7B family class IIb bacteriocin